MRTLHNRITDHFGSSCVVSDSVSAMTVAEGVAGAGLLKHLAKSSHSLSSTERRELQVACEAGKEVLQVAAQKLVE